MQAFCEDEMIIGFVKERPAWEYRVAVIPQTVKQLIALGHQVCFENGCGERAGYFDNQYIDDFQRLGIFADFKIIGETFLTVFKKEHIYEEKADDSLCDEEAARKAEEEIIRLAHLPD